MFILNGLIGAFNKGWPEETEIRWRKIQSIFSVCAKRNILKWPHWPSSSTMWITTNFRNAMISICRVFSSVIQKLWGWCADSLPNSKYLNLSGGGRIKGKTSADLETWEGWVTVNTFFIWSIKGLQRLSLTIKNEIYQMPSEPVVNNFFNSGSAEIDMLLESRGY